MKETIFKDIHGHELDVKELQQKRAEIIQIMELAQQNVRESLINKIVNYMKQNNAAIAAESAQGDFRTVLVDRRTGNPVKMKNGGQWHGITLREAECIARGLILGTHIKYPSVYIYNLNTGEIVSRID